MASGYKQGDCRKLEDALVDALELQMETNPPLGEKANLAEALCAARLFLQHETAGDPLAASEYPLLQRLGIADHGEDEVTLAKHAEQLNRIRKGQWESFLFSR